MVKQIVREPGRTFSEFSLLTGLTPVDCTLPNISLATDLAGLKLRLPLLSAAMTSVTGHEMALALGKEGGLGVLPVRLPVAEQAAIAKRIKGYEMGFVEDPVCIERETTIDEAVRLVERHGHSKLPVTDRNNVFLGLFSFDRYLELDAPPGDPVGSVMLAPSEMECCHDPALRVEQAKQLLGEGRYLVVLDELNRLVKLAFRKDVESIPVAAAISTHKGWQARVEANLAAGVDMIVIDTSDAHSEFVGEVLAAYRAMETGVPICAGNVITADGATYLMKQGADVIKIGMSSGSICTTQRQKATGRAPLTALIAADRARQAYHEQNGRYVPLVVDGGVGSAGDMIIALTLADAVMMGGYFNHFLEAAGEKFDENMRLTSHEPETRRVATWGEGSARARNLDRYGHASAKSFFTEGEEGTVEFHGRLKPRLKEDMRKVKAALGNVGCRTLAEFRERAVIELMSPRTRDVVGDTHSIHVGGG